MLSIELGWGRWVKTFICVYLAELEKELMVTSEEGWGKGRVREFGMDGTHCHIQNGKQQGPTV